MTSVSKFKGKRNNQVPFTAHKCVECERRWELLAATEALYTSKDLHPSKRRQKCRDLKKASK